jgi:hypothetical protein
MKVSCLLMDVFLSQIKHRHIRMRVYIVRVTVVYSMYRKGYYW